MTTLLQFAQAIAEREHMPMPVDACSVRIVRRSHSFYQLQWLDAKARDCMAEFRFESISFPTEDSDR
jgi:hypothetical protein